MKLIYEWLAHKMITRNIRFIRAGLTYRWFFLAFWVCFALLVITGWTPFKILCGILLLCSIVTRALWRRRNFSEFEKLIKDEDNSTP